MQTNLRYIILFFASFKTEINVFQAIHESFGSSMGYHENKNQVKFIMLCKTKGKKCHRKRITWRKNITPAGDSHIKGRGCSSYLLGVKKSGFGGVQPQKVHSRSLSGTFKYSWISHDVTAAMLVSPNNEMAAMLVSRSNPPGIESYYYANVFFCS